MRKSNIAKFIISAIALCLIIVLCVYFVKSKDAGKAESSQTTGTSSASASTETVPEESAPYVQTFNEDGIAIDMRDNEFFISKQDDYEYPAKETISYYSPITGTNRHANVLLPVDYSTDTKYPVLYLMHGLGGSHNTWINKDADIIIRNLQYFENVTPMIVVLPNSEVNEYEDTDGVSFQERIKAYDLTEKDFIENLKPYIESHYSVALGPENTAIAGNSMGGRNALNTAFKHPEMFGYVGAFSSASVLTGGSGRSFNPLLSDEDLVNGNKFKVLMLMVGKSDDVCGWVTYDIDERLNDQNVDHIFYEVEGGHNTYVWQNALYNFGKMIFK